MNLNDIIESFKHRVDSLSQNWDAISSSAQFSADQNELKLLKSKLEMVQEQNAAIIIDLEHIKKVLNLDEYTSNNVFTLLNTAPDPFSEAPTSTVNPHRPPNTPQSETSPNRYYHHQQYHSSYHNLNRRSQHAPLPSLPQHHHLNLSGIDVTSFATSLEEMTILKKQRTSSTSATSSQTDINHSNIIPSYDDLHSHSHEKETQIVHTDDNAIFFKKNDRQVKKPILRSVPVIDLQEIEHFELQMAEIPGTVAELYEEYETSLRIQILEFEKTFGKGQLSKIPKIRTYQRRRALVCEIDKYARYHGKTTQDAIEIFEKIRLNKNKTVPWLYNNLAKILGDYMTDLQNT